MNRRLRGRILASTLACAAFALIGVGLIAAAPPSGGVFPPNASPYGQSYAEWSANWWQWFMELPPEGHPSVDSEGFDVTDGQSGQVWFLAGVFGEVERTCTIPVGKALFVGLLNAEWSSLEDACALGGLCGPDPDPCFPQTEEEQRAIANCIADLIVPESLSCTLDGVPVANLADDFRFESPQFAFTAPTPWIFGATGGDGAAVADGYFVFVKPLAVGSHVLHYTGGFDFDGDDVIDAAIDNTYNLNVVRPNANVD